jgi:ketopantoate reductase
MESTRILVEGIGGIGGVVAGKLIQAGYAPTLVTGNQEILRSLTSGASP